MSGTALNLIFSIREQSTVETQKPKPSLLLDPRGGWQFVWYYLVTALLFCPIIGVWLTTRLPDRPCLFALSLHGKFARRHKAYLSSALGSHRPEVAVWAAEAVRRLKGDCLQVLPCVLTLVSSGKSHLHLPEYERGYFRACLVNYLLAVEPKLVYLSEVLSGSEIAPVRAIAARNLGNPVIAEQELRQRLPELLCDSEYSVRFDAICSLCQRLELAPPFYDLIVKRLAIEKPRHGFSIRQLPHFIRSVSTKMEGEIHELLLAILQQGGRASLPYFREMMQAGLAKIQPGSNNLITAARVLKQQVQFFKDWLAVFITPETPTPLLLISLSLEAMREGSDSAKQFCVCLLREIGTLNQLKHASEDLPLIEELRSELYLLALSSASRGYEEVIAEVLKSIE